MTEPDRAALLRALPYARRYARALTGSQLQGDALVAGALRGVLSAAVPVGERAMRLALYGAISDAAPLGVAEVQAGTRRRLLLLTALEELPLAQAAVVLRLAPDVADHELHAAREMLRAAAAARVLIIEDQPIIALDIQEVVERCGHRVVGIACSEQEAVEIARRDPPSLVLADINLGAGGDGTTAVARILRDISVPVIFVTAYPERLLTGEGREPAFVMAKPFDPTALAVATYQAVTQGLRAV